MATNAPDIGVLLAPIVARIAESDRTILIAIAERMAAERYRRWADGAATGYDRDRLLACAEREDEIAAKVEALHEEREQARERVLAAAPDLSALTHALFDPRPVQEQYEIQARGERLGAATWRSLAKMETRERAREILLECAVLEEKSAEVLEAILAEHPR